VLKRSHYLFLSKFFLFTNGTQEILTCYFSLMTSRSNMVVAISQEP